MSKLVLSINVSLDSFADHTVAVTADDELHDFFSRLLETTDTALFGRVTYELMESYWPNAPMDPQATESMRRFADRFNAMPKVVFSRTLEKADWNNTRLVRENAIAEILRMKSEPGKFISVGGMSLAQELMRRNLIDEYWIVVHPVVVGTGRRLFENVTNRIDLRLIDTQTFASGAQVLHYRCSSA